MFPRKDIRHASRDLPLNKWILPLKGHLVMSGYGFGCHGGDGECCWHPLAADQGC